MTKKTGKHRSGDPRKRNMADLPGHDLARPMFWQPFRHDECGCYLEWGMAVPDTSEHSRTYADLEMRRWLRTIARFPCPLHGSATGDPAPALEGNKPRLLVANGVWYRALAEDRKMYADRLADHLASGRS